MDEAHTNWQETNIEGEKRKMATIETWSRSPHELQMSIRFIYHWNWPPDWNFRNIGNPLTTFWLILSGIRDIEIGGIRHRLQPGDLVVIPPHSRINTYHPEETKGRFEYLSLNATIQIHGLEWVQIYQIPQTVHLDDSAEFTQLADMWEQLLQAWDKYVEFQPEGKFLTPYQMIHWLEIDGWSRHWLARLMKLLQPSIPGQFAEIDKRVLTICDYIQKNLSQKITTQDLCRISYLSAGHIRLLFRQCLGISPTQLILRFRLQHAKELIFTSSLSLTEIAESTGFDDLGHFSRVFRRHELMSPTEYRKRSKAPLY
jgi:AraC-like DNA-binding protein